ncbi:MAG TPA: A/G-specific adenine glycosylase [Candidatus Paceibacterota bacterium]
MNTKLDAFKKEVWNYYHAHGRHDMAWRKDTSPYAVAVSEIMLQQTQVSRVEVKFASWMKRFPTWRALADAPVKAVLQEWSGLGYNRRALFLKRAAEAVMTRRPAELPQTFEELCELPGIGPNTAGAILAYAFNKPQPFIETNIRSTYIHFFFPKSRAKISDSKLLPLIEKTVADPHIAAHAREWHWALMDYGSYIKSTHPNPSRKSAHHVQQSAFKGSNRELRANILKFILEKPATSAAIVKNFAAHPVRQIQKNIRDLEKEGFIRPNSDTYYIY